MPLSVTASFLMKQAIWGGGGGAIRRAPSLAQSATPAASPQAAHPGQSAAQPVTPMGPQAAGGTGGSPGPAQPAMADANLGQQVGGVPGANLSTRHAPEAGGGGGNGAPPPQNSSVTGSAIGNGAGNAGAPGTTPASGGSWWEKGMDALNMYQQGKDLWSGARSLMGEGAASGLRTAGGYGALGVVGTYLGGKAMHALTNYGSGGIYDAVAGHKSTPEERELGWQKGMGKTILGTGQINPLADAGLMDPAKASPYKKPQAPVANPVQRPGPAAPPQVSMQAQKR